MRRHVGVGAIDGRIIKTGPGYPGLEVVRHDLRCHAAKERKGPRVAGDPVWQLLRPAGLDIGVIGRAKRSHEELGSAHLAGLGTNDVNRRPGIIHE